MDDFCDHEIRPRVIFDSPHKCDKRARYHYRSLTGIVIKLCGRHAGAESHRWKNPRPINEVV